MTVRAGFAAGDIEPRAGLPMGGYAARTSAARGTLDTLRCQVAVLASDGPPLVLVRLDLLYVAGPWAADLRARLARAIETDESRVLVAAVHTHAGPAVFGSGARAPGIGAYESKVGEIAVRTARAALAALEPVSLWTGEVEIAGVGASRRDAGEAIDQRLRTLAARRADGTCAGVVAAFGCHPTVLPPANLLYSRDLFGYAADAGAAAVGAPVLLFNGAAADVSTRFTRRAATAQEAERLGLLLGAGFAPALRHSRPVVGESLSAEVRLVPLRLRDLPPDSAGEEQLAAAAAAVEQARARRASSAEIRLAVSRLEGALAQLHFARQGGWEGILGRVPRTAEVQQLLLGDFRLLAAPGEVFSAAGREICAGGRRLLVCYANDYLGYLVSPEHVGDGEYESLMAMVAPESAAAIEVALREMATHA